MAAWIEEASLDPNGWESTTKLFASWTASLTKAGEYTGTMRRFVQNLETRVTCVTRDCRSTLA